MASKKRPKFLVFPSDLGKNTYQVRKNKLALNGKVVSYNMYEDLKQIKSFNEIMEMPYEEGKQYIEAIKNKHTVISLQRYWNVTSTRIYNKLFKKFDIQVQSPRIRNQNKPEETTPTIINVNPIKPLFKREVVNSFVINLNGSFIGKEITNRVINILTTLNENDNYKINLKINDIDPSSKLKSNIEHLGMGTGKEIQDQIQNLKLLPDNKYKIEFLIEEQ